MNIENNNWSLILDLNGGRIKELKYKNTLVFGTYNRIDGKEGSTHICAPSFDAEGQEKYNLPFHGFARTLLWGVKRPTADSIVLTTHTLQTEAYPAELELTQEITLGSYFKHKVSVNHLKGGEVPVNIGIHYYWDTPQGWSTTKINNMKMKTSIETNHYTALQANNTIIFPHATYELQAEGIHSAALWTSFVYEGYEKKYSQDFCCIEPIKGWPDYFGTEKSILKPGMSVSASVRIKKVV